MTPKRGRPRAAGPSTSGLTTEQDLLNAAARAFCDKGFGGQSTYAICAAAGVRQGAMYHHFANKHAILRRLLLDTVRPSVTFAENLDKFSGPSAEVKLWALCTFDAAQLAEPELNIGKLYLLPETSGPEMEEFHRERGRLVDQYRRLIGACDHDADVDTDEITSMAVALIESVTLIRRYADAPNPRTITTRIAKTVLGLVNTGPQTAGTQIEGDALRHQVIDSTSR